MIRQTDLVPQSRPFYFSPLAFSPRTHRIKAVKNRNRGDHGVVGTSLDLAPRTSQRRGNTAKSSGYFCVEGVQRCRHQND